MCIPIFAGIGAAMLGTTGTAAATGTMAAAVGTAAVVGTVASVAGGVMSAVGQYKAGESANKMAQYQSEAERAKAAIARQTADQNISAVQEGAKFEAKNYARKLAAIQGQQKGLLAAQGYGGGSVSAEDIFQDTLDTANLDKAAIRYNADQKSWGIENNAIGQVWDSNIRSNQFLMAGADAKSAGKMAAASSLLSTASQTGKDYMQYKYYTKG